MNKLITSVKTHKVEMPDGRLIQIDGGDAADVAAIIQNSLDAQTVANASGEEPLVAPGVSFDRLKTNEATTTPDDDAPLVMPPLV